MLRILLVIFTLILVVQPTYASGGKRSDAVKSQTSKGKSETSVNTTDKTKLEETIKNIVDKAINEKIDSLSNNEFVKTIISVVGGVIVVLLVFIGWLIRLVLKNQDEKLEVKFNANLTEIQNQVTAFCNDRGKQIMEEQVNLLWRTESRLFMQDSQQRKGNSRFTTINPTDYVVDSSDNSISQNFEVQSQARNVSSGNESIPKEPEETSVLKALLNKLVK